MVICDKKSATRSEATRARAAILAQSVFLDRRTTDYAVRSRTLLLRIARRFLYEDCFRASIAPTSGAEHDASVISLRTIGQLRLDWQ